MWPTIDEKWKFKTKIKQKMKLNFKVAIITSTLALICLYESHLFLVKWFINLSDSFIIEAPLARYHREKIFWICTSPPDLNRYFPLRYDDEIGESDFGIHHKYYEHKPHGSRSESQASMKLAKEMIKQGRPEKALKIYLHALALDPHNSDLLNNYGEFLETYKKDIVSAGHAYWKAHSFNPSHVKALLNHRRTSPLVQKIDSTRFHRIETKLGTLLQVPDNHPGLRRQAYEQYIRHIYHTTAMEGNTFTLSQTRSFVENRVVINGKSIMEHNEILGMEAAMHFLNSSLLNGMGEFTIRDITEIHKRVLGYVDPIGSGVFRTTQVFVGNFVPPRPDKIKRMMEEFMEWLNSEETINNLHPIEAAALAHYKLVYIHPFYDGNGRTSRMLMNLILMLAHYPPIIIPVEYKQRYYEYLESANQGDVRPFIRFISECTEKTLDEYLIASTTIVNRTFPEISDNYHEYDGLTIVT